ncbi:MAG: P-II family nitrogen regulator [Hyphomicrobium sp.]
MKLVTAIIKPFKLDAVRADLARLGLAGMTVTEVKGCGRQRGVTEFYRGAEYRMSFLPKLKIEIVVPADRLAGTLEVMCEAARTGRIGDGKIFVQDVEQLMRIRTGDFGQSAL